VSPEPVTFYDISSDSIRPITQEELDKVLANAQTTNKRIFRIAALIADMERLLNLFLLEMAGKNDHKP
jgi:hypothetical protein